MVAVKKKINPKCRHRELILNYFRAKKEHSSGVVEGLNNKAKVVTRRSYGFRSLNTIRIATGGRIEKP